MAFFEDKETEEVNNSLWVERYRPKKLDEYVGNEHLKTKVADYLQSGDVPHLLFYGKAGTGKTTLARGLIMGLGYSGSVKSPTYTLIEQYEFDVFTLNHFDLYRFTNSNEWFSSGFQEYINSYDVGHTIILWYGSQMYDLLIQYTLNLGLQQTEFLYNNRLNRLEY